MSFITKITDWVSVQRIKAKPYNLSDASGTSPDKRLEAGLVKRLGYRNGDVASRDFEAAEFALTDIQTGYNVDGYIRQGVDKYVDQIFKEGYELYGKNEKAVEYINTRLGYMSEVTGQPMDQFITELAEDIVKYANAIVVKARAKDKAQIPPGLTIKGLMGAEPIAGYFLLNPTTMTVKRDANGSTLGWQQTSGEKVAKFKSEDVIHFYYKRERGNAFGTPFLVPVLDDVRALRQAEENALRMLYRNIYPFYHVSVGANDQPGMAHELDDVKDSISNMNIEGGLVTTNRVAVQSIASNNIVDAEPYLRYCEDRVFTGLGVPAIMFGRGGTANRSTGDNMSSEMSDRIQAMQKTIESFFNHFIVRELLIEGGFDPTLNKDDIVLLRFHHNDQDKKIKMDNDAIYKYEHNAITEDEMRNMLGMDPITDRAMMHQSLITQANAAFSASIAPKTTPGTTKTPAQSGSKEANNKQKPTNQYGTKPNAKKNTNSEQDELYSSAKDSVKKSLIKKIRHTELADNALVAGVVIEHLLDFASTYKSIYGVQVDECIVIDSLNCITDILSDEKGYALLDFVEIQLDLFYDEIDKQTSKNNTIEGDA